MVISPAEMPRHCIKPVVTAFFENVSSVIDLKIAGPSVLLCLLIFVSLF